ncbi:MAG TPA: UTP--glucose-1-phosphate uridylyltransferase, partial [Methanobacterium sp.]|nr:UTP--glucose-1-phosphate uridylyltransferase [Methanobacterium sp.]
GGKTDYLKEVESISELADIYYVRQKQQKGLGDAISCAKKHIDGEPFAVLLGDTIAQSKIPCTKQLINVYDKYKSAVIAIEEVPDERVERYGIVDGTKIDDSIYKINDLVEKPKLKDAPSNLGILGRYILTPEIFDYIDKVPPGVGGEIQLTDALRLFDESYACIFSGKLHDIGNTVDWLKSSIEIALEHEDVRDELIEHLSNILK